MLARIFEVTVTSNKFGIEFPLQISVKKGENKFNLFKEGIDWFTNYLISPIKLIYFKEGQLLPLNVYNPDNTRTYSLAKLLFYILNVFFL